VKNAAFTLSNWFLERPLDGFLMDGLWIFWVD